MMRTELLLGHDSTVEDILQELSLDDLQPPWVNTHIWAWSRSHAGPIEHANLVTSWNRVHATGSPSTGSKSYASSTKT